ncbi:Enoyl-(Acyl carrier protein) reductase [Rhodococcus koreensis]|uniref:3-oxoacyl-[acyl-carrier-protein] reductase MabA n=2 Tax=Rhodococcus koreensis TaxID=99653 RepID=A0A1H4KYE5_9NOCA|nr:Enoyl-(Acyl carrier protein) reductase [Rhodococcus koreensis]
MTDRRPMWAPDVLDGVTAIVTGASRGIGRAITAAYVDAGARVVLVSRSQSSLDEACAAIDPTGKRVLAVSADIGEDGAGGHVLTRAIERFGEVTTLVNNAGIHYPTPFLETKSSDWENIVHTNVIGLADMTRAVGAHLVERGSGTVINVSSSWAVRAVPGHTAYVTSKAAVAHFTRTLAREWASRGVTVNAIAPGYFNTEITAEGMKDPAMLKQMLRNVPLKWIAEPEELGPLAVFLASRAAAYVTGSSFTIDGGMELV